MENTEFTVNEVIRGSGIISQWKYDILKATQESCRQLFSSTLPFLKLGEGVEWKHGCWTVKCEELPDVEKVEEELRDNYKCWAIFVRHNEYVSLFLRLWHEEYVLATKVFQRDEVGELTTDFDEYDHINLKDLIVKRDFKNGKSFHFFEKNNAIEYLKNNSWHVHFYSAQSMLDLTDLQYINYVLQDVQMPVIYPEKENNY